MEEEGPRDEFPPSTEGVGARWRLVRPKKVGAGSTEALPRGGFNGKSVGGNKVREKVCLEIEAAIIDVELLARGEMEEVHTVHKCNVVDAIGVTVVEGGDQEGGVDGRKESP